MKSMTALGGEQEGQRATVELTDGFFVLRIFVLRINHASEPHMDEQIRAGSTKYRGARHILRNPFHLAIMYRPMLSAPLSATSSIRVLFDRSPMQLSVLAKHIVCSTINSQE